MMDDRGLFCGNGSVINYDFAKNKARVIKRELDFSNVAIASGTGVIALREKYSNDLVYLDRDGVAKAPKDKNVTWLQQKLDANLAMHASGRKPHIRPITLARQTVDAPFGHPVPVIPSELPHEALWGSSPKLWSNNAGKLYFFEEVLAP